MKTISKVLAIAMAVAAGAAIQTAWLHLCPNNFKEEDFFSTQHWVLCIVQGFVAIVLVVLVLFSESIKQQSNKK